jgi:replicative DNA helicase
MRDARREVPHVVPATFEGRVPPNDVVAERALLNLWLVDNAFVDLAADIVRPEMFYDEANRRIAEACLDFWGKGQKFDAVTVSSWLKDRDRLAQVGGMPYLGTVLTTAHSANTAPALANIVADKYRIRCLILECQQIAARGYVESQNAAEYIERAESGIYAIAHEGQVETSFHIKAVLKASGKKILETSGSGRMISGRATGLARLDRLTSGLHDKDLTIVAARPGLGKTSYAAQIAVHVAEGDLAHKCPPAGVLFFSLEMPADQICNRMACARGRADWSKLRTGIFNPTEWERWSAAALELSRLPIWVDDKPSMGLLDIRARVRRKQAEIARIYERASEADRARLPKGLGLVVIDYLQLMAPGDEDNREQQISALTRGLKGLAKESNLPFVVLSQLNRGTESRGDKRPGLADLRESGAIEQDADNVVLLYRDDYYMKEKSKEPGVAEIIVAKQRSGATDTVKVKFDARYTRFEDLPEGEYYERQDDDR